MKAFGSVGQDISHYNSSDAYEGPPTIYTGCYCDTAYSAEIDADGPLFDLPGGVAHLAGGGGWRDNRQNYTSATDGASNGAYDAGQHSYYLFGEISLPLIGPQQDIAWIRRLVLSAAGRWEDYPGMAREATPKLGLLYEPDRDFSFKLSWGKSFKAPTLYQLGLPEQSHLIPASDYGIGTASQSLLYLSGGNPDLKPETATNLTAGLAFHPARVPGLKIEASYFRIHYRNRILDALNSTSQGIDDPAYASLVEYNPSAADVAQLFANSKGGIFNYTGNAIDPTTVVAVENSLYLNVASQVIKGADFSVSYQAHLRGGSMLGAQFAGTYLDSKQKLLSDLPYTQLSGTIFNPPKLKFRAGLTYTHGDASAAAFVNYTGSFLDNLNPPYTSAPATATLDLDTRIPLFRRHDGRPGAVLSLIVNDVLNTKPPMIIPIDPTETPYDSTNYAPIGRMVGFGLSRSW